MENDFQSELRHEQYHERRGAMVKYIERQLVICEHTTPSNAPKETNFHDVPVDCLRGIFEYLGGTPHLYPSTNQKEPWLMDRFSFSTSLSELKHVKKCFDSRHPRTTRIPPSQFSDVMKIVETHYGSRSSMRQFFETTSHLYRNEEEDLLSSDEESLIDRDFWHENHAELNFALISFQCYKVYKDYAPVYLLLRNGFSNRDVLHRRLRQLNAHCGGSSWNYELAFLVMDNQLDCVNYLLTTIHPHFWNLDFFKCALDSCAFECIQRMCHVVGKPALFDNPKGIYIQWYKDISAQITSLKRIPSKNYDLVVQLGKLRFSMSKLQDKYVKRAFGIVMQSNNVCLSELRNGEVPHTILSFDYQQVTRDIIMRLEMLCFVDDVWKHGIGEHWNAVEQCLAQW
eukprot:CAMPEP_0117436176 /NCGR_PEP_ID=MMETSP0759-20121206/871_1 /TAXON_ID=63605 /ORGANISM="Percolomonas cosmopolitus, Strain WS" /LENGTH=397 /DNA_ID=CAMNT_0005227765 /DNA_START=155 /DNA_END=1345 /DNA_ORIENTATION=-